MKIELREDCSYAMLVPTSMGVRITPTNGQPFIVVTHLPCK